MIAQNQSCHRFNHRNGPRQNARIMSPTGGKLTGFAGYGDSLLRAKNRRRRLERHPETNALAIADSTLNPSGEICPSAHPAVSDFEGVVVFRAGELAAGKT